MSRRLIATVHVHTDDGRDRVYKPGDVVPAADAAKITNPKAWEGEDDPSPVPPPMGGAGSGKEAWATYAADNGVQVPADATRDDIVAACAAAELPTE